MRKRQANGATSASGAGGAAAGTSSSTSRNAAIFLCAFALCLVTLQMLDVSRVGSVVNVSIIAAPPSATDAAAAATDDDIWTLNMANSDEGGDPEAEDADALTSALDSLAVQVSRTGSALPRTMTVPYNEMQPGERYFLYSPGGGFNNQLICFYAGVFLAKKYNRTLVVPPAGRHANKDSGYYALGRDETVPMDHVLDLDYISRALDVRLLPLNGTLKDFHVGQLGGKTRSTELVTYVKWPGIMLYANNAIRRRFMGDIERATTPVVFAKGHFFNQYFPREAYWHHLRYAPYLSQLSRLIVDETLGSDFDAYHMRLGDYNSLAHSYARNARGMVRMALSNGLEASRPLYLATDGKVRREEDGKFTPWYEPFQVFESMVTQTELLQNARVTAALSEFKARMPPSSIYMTVFGIVEQLVCARARVFVGTHMSTFTQTILRLREHIPTTVPDMVEDKDDIVWQVGGTFKSQWDGRTTWRDVTCNLTTAEPGVVCERDSPKQH